MSNMFLRFACRAGLLISLSTVGCVKSPDADIEGISGAAEASQPPALAKPAQAALLKGSEAAWNAARASHPFHFQGVFAAARGDGQTTVVVMEPPPHARAVDVQKILHASAIGVRPWRIGLDGELRDLNVLFEGNPGVVTIVAHSPNVEEVELLEERIGFSELAHAVPPSFDGLLELRICNAESSVADRIRRASPRSIVRAPDGLLDLPAVAWSYARTLRLVADGIPYDDAARRAHVELVKLSAREEA